MVLGPRGRDSHSHLPASPLLEQGCGLCPGISPRPARPRGPLRQLRPWTGRGTCLCCMGVRHSAQTPRLSGLLPFLLVSFYIRKSPEELGKIPTSLAKLCNVNANGNLGKKSVHLRIQKSPEPGPGRLETLRPAGGVPLSCPFSFRHRPAGPAWPLQSLCSPFLFLIPSRALPARLPPRVRAAA